MSTLIYYNIRGLKIAESQMNEMINHSKHTEKEWHNFVGPLWLKPGFAYHVLMNFNLISDWIDQDG